MRIVAWNVNGLRAVASSKGGLLKVLESLDGDIICFQETKLAKDELVEDVALAPGWDSFFDFATRPGYSGVATFCRNSWRPVACTRGVTGEAGQEVRSALDCEGRCVCTDHGAFVLFNVYVPALSNEETAQERMEYKLQLLRRLHLRMEELRRQGRHVAIVGDFNISPAPIDHCDPSPTFYAHRPDRCWMHGLLQSERGVAPKGLLCLNGTPERWEGHSSCNGFVDTFRLMHPGRQGAYTCWNTATGARNNNWGTRIDLILVADPCTCTRTQAFPVATEHGTRPSVEDVQSACDEGGDLLCERHAWSWQGAIIDADISPGIFGSDHAPTWVALSNASLPQAECGCSGALPQSSRHMLSTQGRQKQLHQLWLARSVRRTDAPGDDPRAAASLGARGRGAAALADAEDRKASKRRTMHAHLSSGPSQASLKRFISAASRATTSSSAEHGDQGAALSAGVLAGMQPVTFPNAPSGCSRLEQGQQLEVGHSPSGGRQHETDTPGVRDRWLPSGGSQEAHRQHAVGEWRTLLARYEPVRCRGHSEPCVLRQVKKAGPNRGRLFYVCARDDGPPPLGRCDFFQWVKRGQRKG